MRTSLDENVLVRSEEELELMRTSGEITAKALKKTLKSVKAGISLEELEKVADDEIIKLGGRSSFKTVPNYHWTTCLTINDEVVHGPPRRIKLQLGDKLSIDLGAVYPPAGGWHTDCAWSVLVADNTKPLQHDKRMFLKVGEEALWAGVAQAVDGNRVGDISYAIQTVIEGGGFNVVRSLVGHGVGKKTHEDPEIPGFGKKGTGMVLQSGMTLAIEAIYTSGSGQVYQRSDGWTIASSDGSLGGLFEMSVIVGKNKAEVLTDWRRF